ncbi:MAG: hypothetical protein J0L75_12175 [Spirochaetes bacterium]|nr:hypothetical protein [Spirochaetota bacterium]
MKYLPRAALVLLAASFALAPRGRGASLDFINIPVSPKEAWCGGMPRSGGEAMDGLWYNPSYLGSLELPVSFALGMNLHLGTTLLAGGAAFKLGAFSFGLGASGLLMDSITGDLQFAGDGGRLVPAGSIRATAAAALHFGEADRARFRIGAGFQIAAETLDSVKQNAQFAQVGALFTAPIASRFTLGIAADGRGLLVGSKTTGLFSLPPTAHAALSLSFDLNKHFDFAASVEGSWNEVDGVGVNLGLEGRFRKMFFLRVGSRFEANPSFTVGGGVMFDLPGPSALGLDLVGLPGRPGGETVAQIVYAR